MLAITVISRSYEHKYIVVAISMKVSVQTSITERPYREAATGESVWSERLFA